jgi:tetratricopeptide (TPR) repeat protein
MIKPESIKALLNHPPQQRRCKDRLGDLDNPISAVHLNEASLCHEKSCECLVAANDYFARGLQEKGDQALEDAISYSRRTISHLVTFSEAYINIASACLLKGDFKRAIEACKEIQHLKPDALDVHFYWARRCST